MPELKHIPLGLIDGPDLPMRSTMDEEKLTSLMNSIVTIGQRYPAEVIERDGRYEIRTGHRRYVALERLGRETMMCLVLAPGEDHGAAIMIAENLEREDVNRAEEAVWFAQLMDKHGWDADELVKRTKRSEGYISDSFRLLRQDSEVFNAVLQNRINFSVARELNKCTDEPMRRNFLDQAIRSGTGARVVAEWVSQWRVNTGGAPTPIPQPAPAGGETPPPQQVVACQLCGGHLDPYNLISVFVHKWEWENLQRLVREAAKAEAE